MLPNATKVKPAYQQQRQSNNAKATEPLFHVDDVGNSDHEDETLNLQQRIIQFGTVQKHDLPQINTILTKYGVDSATAWYKTLLEIQKLLINKVEIKFSTQQQEVFKDAKFGVAVQTTHVYQLGSANQPDITTVRCKDKLIKGSQLVRICAQFEESLITRHKPAVTKKDAADTQITIQKASDWLVYGQGFSNRGVKLFQGERRSSVKTDSYSNGNMKKKPDGCYPYSFTKITMPSGATLRLDRDTDRLHLEENLQFGDKSIADITGKSDIEYYGIAAVFTHIKTVYKIPAKGGGHAPIDDATIVRLQLKCLKGEKISGITPELHKWLDFCNVLMFGVEASRFHGGIITGIMTLELVRKGHLTYSELFEGVELQKTDKGDDSAKVIQFGGQYFGATLKSGEGNIVARQQAIAMGTHMKLVRSNPIHYAALIKEIMIIKNWLGMKGIDPTKYSENQFMELLNEAFIELFKSYLQ